MTTATGPTTIASLQKAKYIALTTFRKDGRAVTTPVWLAFEGDAIVAFTEVTSGKVKRLRNSDRVLVARCDGRGRMESEAVEAKATLTDAAGTARILDAIKRRYGIQARLLQWFAERRGKDAAARQIGIIIRLATEATGAASAGTGVGATGTGS